MDSEKLIEQLIQDPSFARWVRHHRKIDATYWEHWLQEHPHYHDEVNQAREIVQGVSFHRQVISPEQLENSWQQVSRQTAPSPGKRLFWKQPAFRYAASISIVLLACLGIWKGYRSATITTFKTPYGETRTILLEDGTQVILNANSELTVSNDWLDQPEREVFLEGEAYFSVTQRTQSQALMPFVVHTEDLSIQVVGTQFNVNSRRGETHVVLDEGKVALQIPETAAETMEPGDYIAYSSDKKEITRQQVNPEIYTSWRKQLLTLDDTPFDHIIRQLEDTYGVSFVVSDQALSDRKISSTGSITAEDLDTILEALSTLLQVRFEKTSNTIYIYEN
ncbi:MAG: FecR domain-containing protein [Cyclobacteriaceae bacterium]